MEARAVLAAVAVSAAVLSLGVAVTPGAAEATPTVSGDTVEYSVLADAGASRAEVTRAVEAAGGRVVDVNEAIGLYQVDAPENGFVDAVASKTGIAGAAHQRAIGRAPESRRSDVERPGRAAATTKGVTGKHGKGGASGKAADPLDDLAWGLDMVHAEESRKVEPGDKRVTVGIIDTGVDASHPDIAPNFSASLSRNFVTDMPDIDGACEFAGCVDPVGWDDGGHGTHVAGIIGAAANGLGMSGVAPKVTLVEARAGQDSGYFFLQPTVDALTYAGDAGLDVVNMSFYVDPWLYNCTSNPADSPEDQLEQRTIIEAVSRALDYAYRKGVTLVSALGNEATDLGHPTTDATSPDYGGEPYTRTIDNATCLSMPTEGPHVIGVSALGASGRKAYYSNWGTEQISVAAPGGDYYDPAATGSVRDPGNLILSTYPKNVAIAEGDVDPETGDVTPQGEGFVIKDCTAKGVCGYYEYLQGTSMASPFAAGVAALVVSRYGRPTGHGGFGLAPARTERILEETATETACPAPVYVYDPPIPASYSANCEGTEEFNGFYGYGVVDALAAVTRR